MTTFFHPFMFLYLPCRLQTFLMTLPLPMVLSHLATVKRKVLKHPEHDMGCSIFQLALLAFSAPVVYSGEKTGCVLGSRKAFGPALSWEWHGSVGRGDVRSNCV